MPERCEALRALNIEAMTAQEIYDNRNAIGRGVVLARHEYQEYQDHAETRARGWRCREYVESVADKLKDVVQP